MKAPRKVYSKKCPFCDKEISSLSKGQFDFNYYSHVGACKQKHLKALAKKKNAKSFQNSSTTSLFISKGVKPINSNGGADHNQTKSMEERK